MSELLPATLEALWSDQGILDQISVERGEQDIKWGPQSHPDGTDVVLKSLADEARTECQASFASGAGTWLHILEEEFCEAAAEEDPSKLRVELVQIAAVCAAWIQDIDSRA